ncbi:MAG: hypothetical protein ACK4RT_11865, partial [Erythrobacter sp.]
MTDDKNTMAGIETADESLRGFFDMQGEAMREMFASTLGGGPLAPEALQALLPQGMDVNALGGELGEWASASAQLQQLWLDFAAYQ